MIELLAYDSRDRMVRGLIELDGDRLADVLVRPGRSVLAESTRILGLRDGRVGSGGDERVDLEELSIVVATGPRGDQYRRVVTISLPVSVHVGRYVVCGHLHAPAPRRPLLERDSRTWFAITEAVIEYTCQGRAVRERHDAILVNRAHVSDALPMDAGLHEARWLASRAPAGIEDGRSALAGR